MKITQKNLSNNNGFTLIEVSIVILILSFLMVPIFNFIVAQHMHEKNIETEEVNQRVLAALALYVKNQGHYPCPSDPTLNYGDANFGHQDCPPGITPVIQGELPIYDLGIPFRLMVNGHNFRYWYAVSRDQTDPTTFDGGGDITIVDEGGTTITANVPYVIVDMGHDGKGSVKLANGQIKNNSCDPPPGGPAFRPLDSENCDNDDVFLDMPYSERASSGDTGYYDDVIFYDLAREESTLWMAKKSAASGGMEITNRNTGNIGIGEYSGGAAPGDKLEVTGGNVRVDTGDVKVGATGKVQGGSFCYDPAGCGI